MSAVLRSTKNSTGNSSRVRHTFGNLFARAFPTPKFLSPAAAGIDVSDTSVKWLAFKETSHGYRISSFGDQELPKGMIRSGVIEDGVGFVAALSDLKKSLAGIVCVHAALPEEAAYVFDMHVPHGTSREQTMRLIEFEFEGRVPIPVAGAVYDFDIIEERLEDGMTEIGVTVFPRELSESYAEAFDRAGFTLLSLEVEARSIGRAISSTGPDEPVTLVVDFGRARTGLAVLKHGVPIFTSTVEIGGDSVTNAVEKQLSLMGEAVEKFKNDQGLLADGGPKSPGVEAIIGTASALAAEVVRHYNYWDTRRNEHGDRVTPVGRVILVGGSANLRGLAGYIAGRVQAPVEVGDVWHGLFSYDEYIPPISRRSSLEYATAAGLALRGLRGRFGT
jgi:type IV pilus assembly protein PilM